MYIYFVYFVALFLLSFCLDKKNVPRKAIQIYYLFVPIAFIFLVGSRAETVGIDTGQYAYIWNYDIKAGNFDYIDTEAELGFYYLQTFFKLFVSYQSFLFIIGGVSIVPICYVVYRYSKKCALAVLIFYSSIAFHALEFAAARQALAFTGVIIAFNFLMERKLKCFLATLFISALFHQTASCLP